MKTDYDSNVGVLNVRRGEYEGIGRGGKGRHP